jgi:hypothetical protein
MALCYKDKTFCSSDCTRSDCYRYFSEEDREGAKEWAKVLGVKEASIAWSDYSSTCFWYKPPVKE